MVRSALRVAKVWGAIAVVAVSAPALAQDVAKPAKSGSSKAPEAAQSKDGSASKKKDVSAALKAYDTGTRAFESGKMEQAVQSLSTALSSGGLPSQQMAKALYYRGTAYRKQGKPAQAISDLTTAVWLKNGLSDADRALAVDQRQGAYREAGLGDAPPPVAQQKSSEGPSPAAVAAAGTSAPPPPSITPGANVSVPGNSSMFSWLDFGGFGSSSAPAPAVTAPPQPVAAAPAAQASDAATSSWSTTAAAQSEAASVVASNAAPAATSAASIAPSFQPAAPTPISDAASAAPAAQSAVEQVALNAAPTGDAAAPEGPNALEKAGTAITGFFGNVFQANSQAGAQATNTSSSPVLTSSTGADAAPAASQPAAAMPWNATTAVAAKTQKQAILAPPAAPASAVALTGKYRLQVAAVRSRTEADQIAARIAVEHAKSFGARQTLVDEAVIGNMGTFYRVRVGPYADAGEPERLCGTLRPQGFDCLVVTQ